MGAASGGGLVAPCVSGMRFCAKGLQRIGSSGGFQAVRRAVFRVQLLCAVVQGWRQALAPLAEGGGESGTQGASKPGTSE